MPSAPICFSSRTCARAACGVLRPAEHGIDEDARRGDLALGALPAEFHRAFGVAAHVADGGDAAGQPDIQLVFDGLRLAAALLLQVGVRIDQARQHVLSGGVDHRVGLRGPAPSAAQRDRIERNHVADGVVLDYDVLGPAGRRAVAIHHGGVVNQQAAHAPPAYRQALRPGCGNREAHDQETKRHGFDCATKAKTCNSLQTAE